MAKQFLRISFTTEVDFEVLQEIAQKMTQIQIQLHWQSWFQIAVYFGFQIPLHRKAKSGPRIRNKQGHSGIVETGTDEIELHSSYLHI